MSYLEFFISFVIFLILYSTITNELDNQTTCSICQDDLDTVIWLLSCKHMFCQECLTPWIKENSICPLCRAEITFALYRYPSLEEIDEWVESYIKPGLSREEELIRIRKNVITPTHTTECEIIARFFYLRPQHYVDKYLIIDISKIFDSFKYQLPWIINELINNIETPLMEDIERSFFYRKKLNSYENNMMKQYYLRNKINPKDIE
ncbi:uncharacterized protein LOC126898475 [Daktulosphaira vitifoliae]|uniref:uncharacterized protein LOC126898475 n=1 Tax=Daktulosphaira vitifoliae TaxID=58002 RepID=UPI0021AA2712|nr:uncharacterized protein LOC126898475 [Daktulosphaira vitifoliae]